MKIQNIVTLKQAQQLDEAIKNAGLEWPGIEWDEWFFMESRDDENGPFMRGEGTAPPWFQGDLKRDLGGNGVHWLPFTDQDGMWVKLDIPAPNLAELAAMINETEGRWMKVRSINVEALLNILLPRIKKQPKHLKAHWETL